MKPGHTRTPRGQGVSHERLKRLLTRALPVLLLPVVLVVDQSADRGPLAIEQARVQQQGPEVVFSIRTQGAVSESRLSAVPGDEGSRTTYICFELDQTSDQRRACLSPDPIRPGQVGLAVGRIGSGDPPEVIPARVSRAKGITRAKVALSDIGLEPGELAWRAETGYTDERRCGAGTCRDVEPEVGEYSSEISEPRVVACELEGPAQASNGSRAENQVALTFDDGPGEVTPEVMDVLSRYGVPGTFFVVGSLVPGNEVMLAEMTRRGFEIGNHTLTHDVLPSVASLSETNRLIQGASNFRPCLFRPPEGRYDASTIALADGMGMTTALWDIDTMDWADPTTDQIVYSASQAEAGSMILMHDGGDNADSMVAALPAVIEDLRSRGFAFVTVSELLGGRLVWEP